MTSDDFNALDAILDDLRTRDDETPQWEFCEGFIAALVSCRRAIAAEEYMPVLLGIDMPHGSAVPNLFTDADQYQQFMNLWACRLDEVRTALATPIEELDDERAYMPMVMDLRAEVAAMSPAQRAAIGELPIPSFGQIWAIGFMYAVESWPEEWATPRDRYAAEAIEAALECIVAVTEDDDKPATISAFDDTEPPGMSQQRADDFASAVWATYELFEVWQSLGPRVETVLVGDKPGRNDPCPCGSGKKYKKCCGT